MSCPVLLLARRSHSTITCLYNNRTHVKRRPIQPQIDRARTQELEVEGHDLPSLLFAYLDEFLFRFSTEAFVAKRATILEFARPASTGAEAGGGKGEGDTEAGTKPQEEGGQSGTAVGQGRGGTAYRVRVRAEGEGFDLAKYVQLPVVRALRVQSNSIDISYAF